MNKDPNTDNKGRTHFSTMCIFASLYLIMLIIEKFGQFIQFLLQ